MTWINPDDVEHIARPVVAVGNDYPAAFELDWHHHRRGQLLYAARGVVVVSTAAGAWIAPPERAVWTPGGTPHSVRMVGATSTRGVLIEPAVAGPLGQHSKVLAVSPLLRDLLVALPRLAAGEAVTTVALDLGYDSPAAFSTMFKRLIGMAPNLYRRGVNIR